MVISKILCITIFFKFPCQCSTDGVGRKKEKSHYDQWTVVIHLIHINRYWGYTKHRRHCNIVWKLNCFSKQFILNALTELLVLKKKNSILDKCLDH